MTIDRKTKDQDKRFFQPYLSTLFLGLFLVICGLAGWWLTKLDLQDVDIYLPGQSLLIIAGIGFCFLVLSFVRLFVQRRHEPISLLDIAEIEDEGDADMHIVPRIDMDTALIIPVLHPYNHWVWFFLVIDFVLLSVMLFFGIAWLHVEGVDPTQTSFLIQQETIMWLLIMGITAAPIGVMFWNRRNRRKFLNLQTLGKELVLDKHGVRMAAALLPMRVQKVMRRYNMAALRIPWHHIRAWTVDEDSELRGVGHKFYVAPFPAIQFKGKDLMKLSKIKIFTIPIAYIRGVEDEVLAMVKTYGPPVVDKLTI